MTRNWTTEEWQRYQATVETETKRLLAKIDNQARQIEQLEEAAQLVIEDAEDTDPAQRSGYAKVTWKAINTLKRATGKGR